MPRIDDGFDGYFDDEHAVGAGNGDESYVYGLLHKHPW